MYSELWVKLLQLYVCTSDCGTLGLINNLPLLTNSWFSSSYLFSNLVVHLWLTYQTGEISLLFNVTICVQNPFVVWKNGKSSIWDLVLNTLSMTWAPTGHFDVLLWHCPLWVTLLQAPPSAGETSHQFLPSLLAVHWHTLGRMGGGALSLPSWLNCLHYCQY